MLCNLLWASTYEYGAPQELTRGSVPDSLADAYSQSPLYPPSGGHGGAPRLSNVGHDFALLSWDAPPEGTVGWRVFSTRPTSRGRTTSTARRSRCARGPTARAGAGASRR